MALTTLIAAAMLTVSQILTAMTANTTGLTSYEVPVNISGHVSLCVPSRRVLRRERGPRPR
jgi:hypothetical protein